MGYEPNVDQECAWVSQWVFGALAQALYRSHTLVLPTVRVFNPEHGEYPRQACYEHMKKASLELRERAPPIAKRCFADPAMGRFLFAMAVGPTSYVPWASARKKIMDSAAVNYGNVTLSDVASCDENIEELHRLAMPRVHRYCPGCPPQAMIYYLQTTTAENPLWGPNWHELSITMWGTMGDLPLARGCAEIARRLEELRSNSVSAVDELVIVLDRELRHRGLTYIADQFSSSSLWTDEGRGIVMKVIRTVLLSIHYADADDPYLLSSEEFDWLIEILIGDHDRALANKPKRRPTPPGLLLP